MELSFEVPYGMSLKKPATHSESVTDATPLAKGSWHRSSASSRRRSERRFAFGMVVVLSLMVAGLISLFALALDP